MADDYAPRSPVRWVRLGHAHLVVQTGGVEIESLDLDSMRAVFPAEFLKEIPAVSAILDEEMGVIQLL